MMEDEMDRALGVHTSKEYKQMIETLGVQLAAKDVWNSRYMQVCRKLHMYMLDIHIICKFIG